MRRWCFVVLVALVGAWLAVDPAPAAESKAKPLPLGALRARTAYRSTVMTPEVRFVMPVKGWAMAQPELSDTMAITKNGGPDGSSADASISVVRVTRVFTNFLSPDPVQGRKAELTADAPSDLVAWLQSIPYLQVSQPTTRRISGVAATVVDIEPTELPPDLAAGTCAQSGDVRCVTLLSLEFDPAYIAISVGTKQTWAILQIGAIPVVVEWDVQATDPATQAADAAQIARIVKSIKISS